MLGKEEVASKTIPAPKTPVQISPYSMNRTDEQAYQAAPERTKPVPGLLVNNFIECYKYDPNEKHRPKNATQVSSFPKMHETVESLFNRMKHLPVDRDINKQPDLPVLKYYKCSVGTYSGQYMLGKRHGYGQMVYNDGAVYAGHWRNDLCDGDGVYIGVTGEMQVGNFREDYLNGVAKINFPNGDVYEGQCLNNVRHGEGTYTWKENSSTYAGEWKDGVRHGKGTYIWADNANFDGSFENGVLHGRGTYTNKTGHQYQQVWEKGTRTASIKQNA